MNNKNIKCRHKWSVASSYSSTIPLTSKMKSKITTMLFCEKCAKTKIDEQYITNL